MFSFQLKVQKAIAIAVDYMNPFEHKNGIM
jgi:hypothetical protein